MNIAFGIIMALIGIVFFVFASIAQIAKKELLFYKFLAAKSRMLWKGGVHIFYMVSGLLIITAGVLLATKNFWLN